MVDDDDGVIGDGSSDAMVDDDDDVIGDASSDAMVDGDDDDNGGALLDVDNDSDALEDADDDDDDDDDNEDDDDFIVILHNTNIRRPPVAAVAQLKNSGEKRHDNNNTSINMRDKVTMTLLYILSYSNIKEHLLYEEFLNESSRISVCFSKKEIKRMNKLSCVTNFLFMVTNHKYSKFKIKWIKSIVKDRHYSDIANYIKYNLFAVCHYGEAFMRSITSNNSTNLEFAASYKSAREQYYHAGYELKNLFDVTICSKNPLLQALKKRQSVYACIISPINHVIEKVELEITKLS